MNTRIQRWQGALLATLATALVHCPSSVRPTEDSALPDSAVVEDAQVIANPLVVELRVALGPFVPEAPAQGFSVLARGAGDQRIEQQTDAEGRVRFSLDRAAAPWDITVARAGYLAVSILDVREPVDSVVYTHLTVDRREAQRPREVTARFRNADESSVASLFSRSLVNSEFGHSPDWSIEQRDDARTSTMAQRFWAIEWRSDGSGFPLRPLRAVQLEDVPSARPGPLSFDVDFNSATIAAAESVVQVELPSTGLVTRDSVRRGGPSRVQFAHVDEEGARYPSFPVGTASADYVRSASGPTITVAHLRGALTPVTASVTYASADDSSFELQLWPTVSGGSSSLRVPSVTSIQATGATVADARFEARAEGYQPGFAVLGPDGQSVVWAGFSQGQRAIERRALPATPAGFSLRDHVRADTARLIATLAHRTNDSAAPWEPGAQRTLDVEVDSAFVTIATTGMQR